MSDKPDASYGYPRVIEPLQLEITMIETVDGVSRPVVFPRLAYADLPPGLLSDLMGLHCFGETISGTRQVFFCYEPGGQIVAAYAHRYREWCHCEIPEESAGLPALHPSVRLVFTTEFDRNAFLQLLEQVDDGKGSILALKSCLSKLAQPPRLIPVVLSE